MKTDSANRRDGWLSGFTLIELLVVISIIGILAAMVFPVRNAVERSRIKKTAYAELNQVETAIDSYKARYGHYPPDNTTNTAVNGLYFELMGCVLTNNWYYTLDGSAEVEAARVPALFGVDGFVNSSRGLTTDDERRSAVAFLKGLRPQQRGPASRDVPNASVLACSLGWPRFLGDDVQTIRQSPGVSPWQYNSSNPTHNPDGFDLWVDLYIDEKTNRISNWSPTPEIVR